MSFPAYPSYWDSRVEWLGHLPSGWRLVRLRHVIECCDGQRVPLNAEQRSHKVGDVPYWGANSIMDYVDEALFDEELILLGEDGAPFFDKFRPVAFRSIGPIWPNNHVHVLRPKEPSSAKFIAAALNMTEYSHFIDGATRDKLTQAAMLDIPLPWPPEFERVAIGAFLDRETAKIDALVEEQRRLIELLKEKRQAVISHAVTKGINPKVPMKDSGVEWLGDVPAHWEMKPLRALFRFVKRQEGRALDVLSVYRDYGVIRKSDRDDNINKTPEDLSSYQTVAPADLVINKMKAWQGSLGVAKMEGIISPDYAVFSALHRCDSDYLNFLLRCQLLPGVYRSISNGIRPDQWRLEPDRFKELLVPVPPVTEQRSIAALIAGELIQIDRLASEVEAGISLLQERRVALISAGVGGKIDVRTVAQQPAEAA